LKNALVNNEANNKLYTKTVKYVESLDYFPEHNDKVDGIQVADEIPLK